MTIHIESLTFDAIIGLLDFERENEQKVIIDLKLKYSYSKNNFIDYAKLANMLTERTKLRRYLLLEEALEDLKEQIIQKYPASEMLVLKISKPDILENCTVALSQKWSFS